MVQMIGLSRPRNGFQNLFKGVLREAIAIQITMRARTQAATIPGIRDELCRGRVSGITVAVFGGGRLVIFGAYEPGLSSIAIDLAGSALWLYCASLRRTSPALTRTMLTEMASAQPDCIVFELGDGLLGTYGVQSILQESDIKRALTAVVLSANDPVAAWGGVKLLRERFGIEPCAVTGPATDNQVGVEIIREQMQVEAFNAVSAPAQLGDYIIGSLGLRNVRDSKVVGE